MKFTRKLVLQLLFLSIVLPPAGIRAQLPNVAWKAAEQLKKDTGNEVKYNEEGFVTKIVIEDFPSGFRMGQLEVFPRLESVTVDSRYYFEDSSMGGVRKLKNLKKFVMKNSRYATSTSLELLAEVPVLESIEIIDCSEISSLHELSRIRRLKHLTLVTDEVTSLKPLTECRNLKSIKLVQSSSVDDSSLQVLAQIATLESIDLSGTGITDEGLVELAKLPNLVELNLKGCDNVTGEAFSEFANPHPLKELNLRDATKLNDAGLAELSRFTDLEKLLLYRNGDVTGNGFQCLEALKKLKLLSCPNTSIRDEHLGLMDGIESLEAIWLPSCPNVSGRGLDCLTQSQSVVRISLNECRKIDSPDFNVLAKFKNLDELYIAKTRIRNEGVEKLCQLEKLRILNVSGNLWLGDEAFEKLQNCSVKKLIATKLPRLTDDALFFAGKMKNLSNLTITAHEKLDGSGLETFVGNAQLRILTIKEPQHLSLEACGFIRQMPGMQELYLSDGEIAIAEFEQLSGMQNLRKLEYTVGDANAKSEQLIAVLGTFPNLE